MQPISRNAEVNFILCRSIRNLLPGIATIRAQVAHGCENNFFAELAAFSHGILIAAIPVFQRLLSWILPNRTFRPPNAEKRRNSWLRSYTRNSAAWRPAVYGTSGPTTR